MEQEQETQCRQLLWRRGRRRGPVEQVAPQTRARGRVCLRMLRAHVARTRACLCVCSVPGVVMATVICRGGGHGWLLSRAWPVVVAGCSRLAVVAGCSRLAGGWLLSPGRWSWLVALASLAGVVVADCSREPGSGGRGWSLSRAWPKWGSWPRLWSQQCWAEAG